MRKTISILCLLLLLKSNLFAQNIAVASIFGDGMVLQQGINVPIWGTSKPNDAVSIAFAGKIIKTNADVGGKWMVKLPVMKYGGPYEMQISTAQQNLILKDILIGEVWLASGQSNMQFRVSELNESRKEINAANYPDIRFFTVALNMSNVPLNSVKGSWKTCSPENAGSFSAVAYFFAKNLHQDKKVPVGVISSSWGATAAEAWTSRESLINHSDYKDSVLKYQKLQEDWELLYQNHLKEVEAARKANTKVPQAPAEKNYAGSLYNAMIAPIVPYGIKGVIWYQGENNANTGRGLQYRTLFPLLINDWRTKWNDEKMPFLYVQLANYRQRNTAPVFKDNWALLREAQAMTLKIPNTGMAVTIDIGEENDIHPKNKKDVGNRLYLAAKHIAYKDKGVVYVGPTYKSMKIEDSTISLSFTEVGTGLMSKGEQLIGFAVAGKDKKFYWAEAEIKGNKVVLKCKEVSKPVAVRYAWSINPPCNLFNKEGLPAVPFRTDDW
jgi:sialate O-acetylesterase